MTEDIPTFEYPRVSDGPPIEESIAIGAHLNVGDRFYIVRKGPLCIMRWDVCEYEMVEMPGIYDRIDVPSLVDVGFGFTRRGAFRSLQRHKRDRMFT